MSDKAIFQATYSDFRLVKGRKVCQFVFETPLEGADEALAALGGMPNPAAEVWCGIARLQSNVSHLPARPSPLAQKIGRLCTDKRFQAFLAERSTGVKDEDSAAAFVRDFCDVQSRSEIRPGTAAEQRWNLLESGYLAEGAFA